MKTTPSQKTLSGTHAGELRNESKNTTQQVEDLLHVCAQATEKAILFEVEAPQHSRVFIAGTFNDWNPSTHPLQYHPEDNVFRATLLLEPGIYEYKFVIDGVWHTDDKCPHQVMSDKGFTNSVINV